MDMTLVKMTFTLISILILNFFNIGNENVIFFIRVFYIVQLVVIALLHGVIYERITRINDQTILVVKEEELKRPSIFPENSDKKINVSVYDYDIFFWKESIQQIALGSIFVFLIHFRWNFLQPLVISAILQIYEFFSGPLFYAHLLEQIIDRPFSYGRKNFIKEFMSLFNLTTSFFPFGKNQSNNLNGPQTKTFNQRGKKHKKYKNVLKLRETDSNR